MKKHTIIILGVFGAIPLVWLFLNDQPATTTEDSGHGVPAQLPEFEERSPELEELVAELPRVVGTTQDNGAPREQLAAESAVITQSCDELSRNLEQQPNRSITFAEGGDVSERNCGLALRMMSAPTEPALPGFSGFEVRDFGDLVALNPRGKLFEEADDPEWSRSMEGRIYGEIGSLIDFPVNALHAVCRTSTCGLLFAFPSTAQNGRNYNYYAREVADALGFSGYVGGVSMARGGIWFTYIYLGDWEMQRPDSESPVPVGSLSFDEAFEHARQMDESE